MADSTPYRNKNWQVRPRQNGTLDREDVQLILLMEIRDALLRIEGQLSCHRIPRVLDALDDLGKEARRRQRKRKKATTQRSQR